MGFISFCGRIAEAYHRSSGLKAVLIIVLLLCCFYSESSIDFSMQTQQDSQKFSMATAYVAGNDQPIRDMEGTLVEVSDIASGYIADAMYHIDVQVPDLIGDPDLASLAKALADAQETRNISCRFVLVGTAENAGREDYSREMAGPKRVLSFLEASCVHCYHRLDNECDNTCIVVLDKIYTLSWTVDDGEICTGTI